MEPRVFSPKNPGNAKCRVSIRLFVDEGGLKRGVKDQNDLKGIAGGEDGAELRKSCVRGLRRLDS